MAVVKVDYKQLVDLGMKIINFMTWPKIAKSLVIAAITIGGYTVWENRQPIYKGIVAYNTQRTMIQAPISPQTLRSIEDLLNKPSKIVGIQLVSVDFRTNTRSTELFRSHIPALQAIFDDYAIKKMGNTPFFTDDEKNNARNTSLINGEFICYQLGDVPIFKRVLGIDAHATTVCSVSIPPYPGYFSGYVNIYLKSPPDSTELIDIRNAIRKLALATYDEEFQR